MDQDHRADWSQGMRYARGEAADVLAAQIIDNLREKDEIKHAARPLLRHEHLLETHAGQIGASTPRLDERSLSGVDGK
jgi:hypothetical protein